MKKILLTGGGTAGHVTPNIALIPSLRNLGYEIHYMGSFDGSTELFTMKADEVVKIQIIIWLEGQDVDCTNMIADASIIANLQFNAVTEGGGGLVPIDPNAE